MKKSRCSELILSYSNELNHFIVLGAGSIELPIYSDGIFRCTILRQKVDVLTLNELNDFILSGAGSIDLSIFSDGIFRCTIVRQRLDVLTLNELNYI